MFLALQVIQLHSLFIAWRPFSIGCRSVEDLTLCSFFVCRLSLLMCGLLSGLHSPNGRYVFLQIDSVLEMVYILRIIAAFLYGSNLFFRIRELLPVYFCRLRELWVGNPWTDLKFEVVAARPFYYMETFFLSAVELSEIWPLNCCTFFCRLSLLMCGLLSGLQICYYASYFLSWSCPVMYNARFL